MKPAFSVIFLTTLLGMAQGCFLAIVMMQTMTQCFHMFPAPMEHFYGNAAIVVLVLLLLGLLASMFHLGRPERAWRAVAKWKTSWLSREVIVLPVFMFAVFVYAVMHYCPVMRPWALWVGWIGVVLLFVLFLCTSMIYACLRFIQEWHSPLTFLNFLLMGLASGFLLATVLACFFAHGFVLFLALMTFLLTIAAAICRIVSLLRNRFLRHKSTIQSAIGVHNQKVVQTSAGHMGGTYNTRAFFLGKKRFFLRSIRWVFLVLVFLVPTLGLLGFFGGPSAGALLIILLAQYFGLVLERWHFFAEAKHPQNLYYQVIG